MTGTEESTITKTITIHIYWAEADRYIEEEVAPGSTLGHWFQVTNPSYSADGYLPVVVRHTKPLKWLSSTVRMPTAPFLLVDTDYVFEDGDQLWPGADWIAWDQPLEDDETDVDEPATTEKHDPVPAIWPRMLTMPMLAAYIGSTPKTLRNERLKIPGVRKLGSHVVAEREVIDQWLGDNDGSTDLWADGAKLVELERAASRPG